MEASSRTRCTIDRMDTDDTSQSDSSPTSCPPKYLVPSMEGCLEGIIVIPDGFDDSVSAIDEDWEEQMDASWERSENYRQYMTTSGDLRT